MKIRQRVRNRQRGVAVIMALLLTTLAITIVASLFWQQQVQVRLIENQRLQLQKQWILRGALDWASLILREDIKYSGVDTLDEPWAAPLAETRLDQYVENGKAGSDIADTTLSGSISDAQARFNLNNLVINGVIDDVAVTAFSKLLTILNLNPEYALTCAQLIAKASPINNSSGSAPTITATPSSKIITESISKSSIPLIPILNSPLKNAPTIAIQNISYTQIEDLLTIPNLKLNELNRLRPYVVFLPIRTAVNVNTAPAFVIEAYLPGSTRDDVNALIASRKTASFRDLADFSNRLVNKPFNTSAFSVSSNYFLIEGKVHMNRAQLDMQALLERNGISTRIVWLKEF